MAASPAPLPAAGSSAEVQLCDRRGALILAAVVAHPGGRWSSELLAAPACLIVSAGLTCLPASPDMAVEEQQPQLIGFAVLRGWRLLNGPAPSAQIWSLIQIQQKYWRRRINSRYLEHEVISSCSLIECDDIVNAVGPSWVLSQPEAVATKLLLGGRLDARVVRMADGRVLLLHHVFAEWCRAFSVRAKGCLVWAVAPQLASAMVTGACCADVSVLAGRERDRGLYGKVPLAVAPSRKMAKRMRKLVSAVEPPLLPAVAVGSAAVALSFEPGKKRFHPAVLSCSCHSSSRSGKVSER